MAFDGIITAAMVKELSGLLTQGKIDKIYQPLKEELVLTVHTRTGNYKVFSSVSSSAPRVHLIEENPYNPPVPLNFCMLLRKHLSGGRIQEICQHESERIIEFLLETLDDLGFSANKKLIFEIMGKHSNIILVDMATGNIIDSIKHVSLDESRARQVLPGLRYSYPPPQDKIGFKDITEEEINNIPRDEKAFLSSIGGISPQVASSLAKADNPYKYLSDLIEEIDSGAFKAHIYMDGDRPADYHIADLADYEDCLASLNSDSPSLEQQPPITERNISRKDFDSISSCINAFFLGKATEGRLRQSAGDLERALKALIEKAQLKKKRLGEDLLEAEDSEHLRLYGELLTASLHLTPSKPDTITVDNYYDGSKIDIPLDPRFSLSKNAQNYYKRFSKAKTAVKEKTLQLEEVERDIDYLESALTHLEQVEKPQDLEAIRDELQESGYIRGKARKKDNRGKSKGKKVKISPHIFTSPSGFRILVGKNNQENDELTLRMAEKTDLWLHTKDIHGSHVIMELKGKEPEAEDIYCAAAIAAYYSKARSSAQVPVDYVKVRYVKKPAGAKPGMVIFTNNRTVYVTPKLP